MFFLGRGDPDLVKGTFGTIGRESTLGNGLFPDQRVFDESVTGDIFLKRGVSCFFDPTARPLSVLAYLAGGLCGTF